MQAPRARSNNVRMDYGGQYNRHGANFFDQRDKENFEGFQSWLDHDRVEPRLERVKDNQEFFEPSIHIHSDNFNYKRKETPYESRKKMDREQFNDQGFPFKTVLKSDNDKSGEVEAWWHRQDFEHLGQPIENNNQEDYARRKDAKVKKMEDVDAHKKDSAQEENKPKKSDYEKFSEFENWLHHQNSHKDQSKESVKVIKFEEEVGTSVDQNDEKEEERKKDAKVKKMEDDDVQKKDSAQEENEPKKTHYEKSNDFEKWFKHQNSQKDLSKEGIEVIKFEEEVGTPMDQNDDKEKERKKDAKVKKMEDDDVQKKDSAQEENDTQKSDYEKFSEFENWLHQQNSQRDLSKESVKVLKFEQEVGTPMDQNDEKEEDRKKDAKVKNMEDDDAQKKDSAQEENEFEKSGYEKFSKFENSQKDLSKEGIKVLKFKEEVGTPMDQNDEKEEERKKDVKVQKMEDDDGQKKAEKIKTDERDHDEKGQDQMFKNEAPDEEMKHQSKKDEEDNTESKSSADGDAKYKYDNLFKKSRADIMPKPIVKEDIRKGLFLESMEPLKDKETDSKLLNSKEATLKLKDMEAIHDEELTLKENNRKEQIIKDTEPNKDKEAPFKETSRTAEILEDLEPIKNEAATFKETNIKDQRIEDIKPVDDTFWKRNFQSPSDEDIHRLANLDPRMMNNNQEYGNLDRRMSDNRKYPYHPRRNYVPRYQDESYISRKSYERQQPRYDSRYIPVRQDYSGRYVPGPRYNSQYDQPRRVNFDYVRQRYNSGSRQYQYEAM